MTIPNCHPNRRYGARGMCCVCYNGWLRKTNPDYNRKCKESCARIGATPEARLQRKNLNLLKRYGITLTQREEMKKAQDYKCRVCSEKKPLVVEHCHKTKEVRGMTCHKCNILVGQLENNYKLLPKVFKYLIKNIDESQNPV